MNTRQEFDYIIVGARPAGCVAMDLFAQPKLSKVRRVLPASDKEGRHRGVYRATNARELSSGVNMCDRPGRSTPISGF